MSKARESAVPDRKSPPGCGHPLSREGVRGCPRAQMACLPPPCCSLREHHRTTDARDARYCRSEVGVSLDTSTLSWYRLLPHPSFGMAAITMARMLAANLIQKRIHMPFQIGYTLWLDNPIELVKIGLGRQNTVTEHHYALPYAKLGDTLRRIREAPGYKAKRAALEFIILNGCRASEATGARWGELDLVERVWTVPASRTKSKRVHAVPLSDAAYKLPWQLVGRRFQPGIPDDAPVFPNSTSGAPLLADVLRPLIQEASRDDQATVHGLRASFRTWAADREYTDEIAEHALGHLTGSATVRSYQRSTLFRQRRELMQAWADYLSE